MIPSCPSKPKPWRHEHGFRCHFPPLLLRYNNCVVLVTTEPSRAVLRYHPNQKVKMSTVHRNSVSGASLSKSVAPSSARARSSTVTSNPLGRSVASTSATPLRQSHLPSANGRAAPKPTIARRDTLLTPASGRQPTSESLGRPQGGSTGQKHDKMQYGKLDNPPRRLAKDTEPRRRHDSPTPPSRVQASTAINGRQHGSSTMQAPGPALKVDLHDASAVTSQAQAQSGAPVPALTSQADGHEPEEVTYVVAHITVPQPNKPQPEETIPGPLPPWLIQSLSATLSATEVGTYQPGLAHLAQLMEEFACSDELVSRLLAEGARLPTAYMTSFVDESHICCLHPRMCCCRQHQACPPSLHRTESRCQLSRILLRQFHLHTRLPRCSKYTFLWSPTTHLIPVTAAWPLCPLRRDRHWRTLWIRHSAWLEGSR